jgi:hypothetical protein
LSGVRRVGGPVRKGRSRLADGTSVPNLGATALGITHADRSSFL